MAIEININFNSVAQKRMLYQTLRGLRGEHRVTIAEYHGPHTDPQRRYYFSSVVGEFHKFLREQGEVYTKEQAHEILKAKLLRESVADPRTGEFLAERVKSITELDKREFSVFLEAAIAWLADMFHIEVPDPDTFKGARAHV